MNNFYRALESKEFNGHFRTIKQQNIVSDINNLPNCFKSILNREDKIRKCGNKICR